MTSAVSVLLAPSVAELRSGEDAVNVVVTPVCSDQLEAGIDGLDTALIAAQGFEGKVGQTQLASGEDGLQLLVGLGPSAAVDANGLRRAAGLTARVARRHVRVGVALLDAVPADGNRAACAQAVAEGLVLGGYRYLAHKSAPDTTPVTEQYVVVSKGGQRIQAALERGVAVAQAVCLARDLVNEPGGSLTAPRFADRATEVASASGLEIRVLDEKQIRAERLGGLLGVNRGSEQPPRFVELRYAPEKPRGSVALVGKGITFDSGGLSIKSADGMIGMKSDLGGAAAILAAMSLVPTVAPRLKVTAYLPLTDNMLGPDATRVGDVLTMRNGKTVEVLNTDAEGRLVLADALSLATEDGPDAIIDLATLTGACEVALGVWTAGIMGTNQDLLGRIGAVADEVGERVWPLPLPEILRKTLDSDLADLRNVGTGRYGGALVAGLFLREFVGDGIPWVHMDIAGPALVPENDGEIVKGGTGFGVRLLAALLANWKKPSRP